MAGTISEAQFDCDCIAIAKRAQELGDSWEWHNPVVLRGVRLLNGYLVKRDVLIPCQPTKHATTDGTSVPETTEEFDEPFHPTLDDEIDTAAVDSSSVSDCSDAVIRQFEYHIAYNNAYAVPVLYFYVRELDGTPVTGDQVWESITDVAAAEMREIDAISAVDHPVLQTPCFQVHPCRTVRCSTLFYHYFSYWTSRCVVVPFGCNLIDTSFL
eukprot:m.541211 g.541211  ORF g.541211 m.541211 type:complete len:212 (-) comp22106_c1_seq7:2195-2830(-)